MSGWTIYKAERRADGSLRSVTFNPLLALVYLIVLALLVGIAVRLWGWAL